MSFMQTAVLNMFAFIALVNDTTVHCCALLFRGSRDMERFG